MLKRILFWTLGILATLLTLFVIYLIVIVKVGPVNLSKEKSIEVTGIVDDLYEGGVNDLVFKLKDNTNIYYINRALENGFQLNKIKAQLTNKVVTLWHAPSRASSGGHIIQLKHNDSLYYCEWKIPL